MQVIARDVIRDEPPARRRPDESAALLEESLIGISLWARDARAAVITHANHDNSILLEGEHGTGKKLLARLIHKCSGRQDSPFLSISALNVSSESIEAALFGCAAMGTVSRRQPQRGLIDSTKGGTLYINAISPLPSSLDEKLARLINYGEYYRAGSQTPSHADVRIILGTSPKALDARSSRQTGASPADRLVIPPLRERPDDIEPLAEHFAAIFCREFGKEKRDLSGEAISLLQCQEWPGNVSELKCVMRQAVQRLSPQLLGLEHLPAHMARTSELSKPRLLQTGIDLSEEMKQLERSLLCSALKRSHGVQNKAAQLLGMKPTTFNTKVIRYGIDVTEFK